MPSQKRTFTGMNLDDDPRALLQGETRRNQNVRISSAKEGKSGAVNLPFGTKPIIYTPLPGINKNIGSLYYEKLKKKYDFFYNSLGFHHITESDINGGFTYLMIDKTNTGLIPILNFKENSPILHINIIETAFEVPEYILYWTEAENPQRKLNISKIKAAAYGGLITAEDIEAAKSPFLYNIPATFESDFTKNFNHLRDTTPQFFTSYIYDDNEQSAWSPVTSIIRPEDLPKRDELYILGGSELPEWLYNRIKLTINLGHARVKRVLIGSRLKDNAPFYIVGEVDKEKVYKKKYAIRIIGYPVNSAGSMQNTTFSFSLNGTNIDYTVTNIAAKSFEEIITEYYNYINSILPTRTVELVHIGQDYDSYISIEASEDFTIAAVSSTIATVKMQGTILNNLYDFFFYNDSAYIPISNEDALKPYDAIPFRSGAQEIVSTNIMLYADNVEGWDNVKVNGKLSLSYNDQQVFQAILDAISIGYISDNKYVIVINKTLLKGEIFHIKYKTSGTGESLSEFDFAVEIPEDMNNQAAASFIAASLKVYADSNQDVAYVSRLGNSISIGYLSAMPTGGVYPNVKTVRTLKRNGVYQWGLVYFDGKKRASNIQTSDELKLSIPPFPYTPGSGVPVVGWELNHLPPIDAVGYAWYRTKNLAFSSFWQYYVGNTTREGSALVLDLTNILNYSAGNVNFPAYTFIPGDRLRVISSPQKPGDLLAYADFQAFDDVNSGDVIVIPFPREEYDVSRSWNYNFYNVKETGTRKINAELNFHILFNTGSDAAFFKVYLRNKLTGTLELLVQDRLVTEIDGSGDYMKSYSINFNKLMTRGDQYEIAWSMREENETFHDLDIYVDTQPGTSLKVSRLGNVGDAYARANIDLAIESADAMKLTIENVSEAITAGSFIEIYRPSEELILDLNSFYEISETYPVLNPGTESRVHSGPEQNQSTGIPAKGTFVGGDAWMKVSEMPKYGDNQGNEGWKNDYAYPLTPVKSIIFYKDRYWETLQHNNLNHEPVNSPTWWKEIPNDKVVHEAMSFSYKFDGTNSSDIGRAEAINPNAKRQRIRDGIRYSLPYIPGTLQNGLASFPLSQNKVYENTFGAFQRIKLRGKRLLVCMDNKYADILINERILLSNTGDQNVAQSDALLNDLLPYSGEFGIGNQPASFAMYGDYAFAVDPYRSAVCLIGYGSVKDLSIEGKVNSEILALCRMIREGGTIVGGIDPEGAEYLMTFKYADATKDRTLAFNYNEAKFTSFYQFIPDTYGRYGTILASHKSDSQGHGIHIHNNPVMNSFYGVKYNGSVESVFNEAPVTRKTWMNLIVKADSLWYCPAITLPSNEDFPRGMISALAKSRFLRREGDYFASFLRDMQTPGSASQLDKLFSGRKLRGDVIIVKLETDSSVNTSLFEAEAFFEISPPTS
jgi:hypothetical protein